MDTTQTSTHTRSIGNLAELRRTWKSDGDDMAARRYHAALVRCGMATPHLLRAAGFDASYDLFKQVRLAEEAEARLDPVGKFARRSSPCGPCFVSSGVKSSGRIVRQTAKFYVVVGEIHQYAKERRVRKDKVHLRPCPSCTDHPRTQYPRGYED